VFHSPKFDQSYTLLNQAELAFLHGSLKTFLISPDPYGPYDALVLLIGLDMAQKLSLKGECRSRFPSGFGLPVTQQEGSSDIEA
jgi:hypothetical protein